MRPPCLQFENVSFTYHGGVKALRDVSFTIRQGERVALLGLNGSGKSTLLMQTNGLLLPDSGLVRVNGVDVCKKNFRQIRRVVGMVFQNSDDQLFMPTLEDDVAFGPRNMGLSEAEIRQRVDEALNAVGIFELRKRAPFQLSGGQKRLAAIATVLPMQPSIMVMDEPTADLDAEARGRLISILSDFNHTLLIATHDIDFANALCTRTLTMIEGQIKE